MLWPVSECRSFLLSLVLSRTFGVDAGCLYAILSDRSVGKLAAGH